MNTSKKSSAKPGGQPTILKNIPSVALISMPTLTASFPSFQLGLLKPTLEQAGISVQTFSMYLYFGTHIGWRLNDALAEVRGCMAGEWIWAKSAFGEFADDDSYFKQYKRNFDDICQVAQCTMADIIEVRDRKTASFIEFCLESVDWEKFDLIGFTVVFQQMNASLALARALKEKYPHIPIIFGGATFEDDIAESVMLGCPWVDYTHCGDGDKSFPDFVHSVVDEKSLEGMPGVMWRKGDAIKYAGRAPNLNDMNSTPVPDFDEYFYARKESGYDKYRGAKQSMLPVETARGCWWGMKQHCTFCGLNRAGMEFRSKSVENVLEMLEELSTRYGILHFDAIDNIMATDYIEDLFTQLAEQRTDINIHYEVRPYLSRKQLKGLRRGGLFSVQPGIESLSTNILKLMKKHSTGMRNLAFIKWCTYYGINNLYNLLTGFAGETEEDFRAQCEVIEKIPHFQPPWGVAQARADRGSPMFTNPERHAVNALSPSPCYPYIYPSDRFDLNRISYYFVHLQGEVPRPEAYEEFYGLTWRWQQSWKQDNRPTLKYFKSWQSIVIEDTRTGVLKKIAFEKRDAQLYEFCNDARSMHAIVGEFDGEKQWVEQMLLQFVEQDLMVCLDDQYLSLALPANPYL